jgi:hypothetical protein
MTTGKDGGYVRIAHGEARRRGFEQWLDRRGIQPPPVSMNRCFRPLAATNSIT